MYCHQCGSQNSESARFCSIIMKRHSPLPLEMKESVVGTEVITLGWRLPNYNDFYL